MIAGIQHFPEELKSRFSKLKRNELVVWWYGEVNSFSRVNISGIELLCENRSDAAKAGTAEIMMKYNMALADLRDGIQ